MSAGSAKAGAGPAADTVAKPTTSTAPRLTAARVLSAALRLCPRPGLSAHAWKVINALLACRTPALGTHHYHCDECGKDHLVPHSCRNRHCPNCQAAASHDWLARQSQCLLPVPYFHIVFTLPHALNPLIAQNRRVMHDLLFDCASATLLTFGQNRFKARLGITMVLHTWSQTLLDHHHVHCIVTGGGLIADGTQWRGTRAGYLLPVRALSKVFQAKYRDGLQALFDQGQLEFHGELTALAQPQAFQSLKRKTFRRKWNVYAKVPFAGPHQVLAYLSRYTHRVAIGNGRLLNLDPSDRTVSFSYKDYADGGKRKPMTLHLPEFLRRFCLHLLPKGFVKIRHYGLLANRGRQQRIKQARTLLSAAGAIEPWTPPPTTGAGAAQATSCACPHCGSKRLSLVAVYYKSRQIPSRLCIVPDTS
jgi:DNA-directed RNA polymerase subunit RPC12/RpoP